MDRVIRNGRVAVLFSPGFGAGWYTSHYKQDLLFDPAIVSWLESDDEDRLKKIESYVTLKYPDEYYGGLCNLTIKWIPEGTAFKIDEYDGSESFTFKENEDWILA